MKKWSLVPDGWECKMGETQLSKQIRNAIQAMGLKVMRIQSGSVRVGKRFVRLAEAGTPDLLVVELGLWLEVKPPTGAHHDQKTLEAQRAWRIWAEAHGVPVAVVHSTDEAIEAVEEEQKRRGVTRTERLKALGVDVKDWREVKP